jgi:hypothetical protein
MSASLMSPVRHLRNAARDKLLATAQPYAGPGPYQLADPCANYFGRKSRGMVQVRGNGPLVLNEHSLVFVLLLPRRIVHIPLVKIRKVERSRSHLGKIRTGGLLSVHYSDHGQAEQVAFQVSDLSTWMQALDQARAALR